jgi:hypothetical protein
VGSAGLRPALLAVLVLLASFGAFTHAALAGQASIASDLGASASPPAVEPKVNPESPDPAEPVVPEPVATDPPAQVTIPGPAAAPSPEEPSTDTAAPPDDPPQQNPASPEPAVPDDHGTEPADDSVATAYNVSTIFQVIWQIQEGCQSHCYGTSQAQDATQRSETTQDATAQGKDASNAVNRSVTVQFVWQQQLGCVAFCYDTSHTQSASQSAQTTQIATAIGDAVARALNLAETLQFVWQSQRVCESECHGVSASQSVSQEASTSQSATASGGSGGEVASPESFFAWLTAFAQNIGATIQTVVQHQKAGCLEHCVGGTQLQQAVQEATTDQTATAGPKPAQPATPPPASPEPPAETSTPPETDSALPPPDTQPATSGPAQVTIGTADAATHARDESGVTSLGRRISAQAGGPARSHGGAALPAGAAAPDAELPDAPLAGAPDKTPRGDATATESPASARTTRAQPAALPRLSLGELARGGADDSFAVPAPAWPAAALALLAALAALLRFGPRLRPSV